MKRAIVAAASIVVLLISCSKDKDGIELQSHDDNRLMDSMHAMMDRMMAMPMTNDPEIDFAKMMIMHHEGAINMANVQLQAGSNDSLKRTAQKIITKQQQEIAELNNILSGLTIDNSDPSFVMELMENMERGGHIADIQVITGDIDNDFATLMIVHHMGAIDNASAYLHHGNLAELKDMANNMIEDQSEEIQELSNWLIANSR